MWLSEETTYDSNKALSLSRRIEIVPDPVPLTTFSSNVRNSRAFVSTFVVPAEGDLVNTSGPPDAAEADVGQPIKPLVPICKTIHIETKKAIHLRFRTNATTPQLRHSYYIFRFAARRNEDLLQF